MATTISGAVTEAKLEAWINKYRPDLAIRDEQGVKGFYRVNIGPAHSFQSCGPTWRDVAARLGAVDVSDER